MSRRDRPTSHLTVFDPGYHRPEVVGGTRRQRQAVASRSRHVTFSSQSESGDDEYSSDSDASGEASEDFRSGRVREVGVRKISGNRRVQIHDSTLAQKTKMRNGRSHKAGDDALRSESVQVNEMASARPSSYVRFKYPVKFHRVVGTQRGQKGPPNFDVPECMRRPTSIGMMPVRQRPVPERVGGGHSNNSSTRFRKLTSSRHSGLLDLESKELQMAYGDDESSTMTSQDVELNGVFRVVHEDEEVYNRVGTRGSENESAGETDPETAIRGHTIEVNSSSSSSSSSSASDDEHNSLETKGQQSSIEKDVKKKTKKKNIVARSSSRTENDDYINLQIAIDNELVE